VPLPAVFSGSFLRFGTRGLIGGHPPFGLLLEDQGFEEGLGDPHTAERRWMPVHVSHDAPDPTAAAKEAQNTAKQDAIGLAYMIPIVGTAMHFAEGDIVEGLISGVGDVLFFGGLALKALKAGRVAVAMNRASVAANLGIGVYRTGQAWVSLTQENYWAAGGQGGEAAIRLLMSIFSATRIPAAKKPKSGAGKAAVAKPKPAGIPEATRLSAAEQATAARLQAQRGLRLRESPHVGAEYVDELGRTYDALGNPRASEFWNEGAFLRSIDSHLLKANDFTVIDMTGFTQSQTSAVNSYINSLPKTSQERIIRIGF
jgi:hypothetical protein